MAEFQIIDNEELVRTVRFIQTNPENKRSAIDCPEHGEGLVVIIDDSPEQPLKINGCCQASIDKKREQIAWVTPFADL